MPFWPLSSAEAVIWLQLLKMLRWEAWVCLCINTLWTYSTDKYIHFYRGFNRLNLEEDTCWNPSHTCCSVRFTWAKYRAECWDWGMKARRERVKNGPRGEGGEGGTEWRKSVSVGWNDKDSTGIACGQQNAGQVAYSCLVFEKWRATLGSRNRQDFLTQSTVSHG